MLLKDESFWTLLFKTETSTDDSYLDEWNDFIACINSGNPPRATGTDGLNALEVIESALDSAPTGTQIQVNRN
jgi:predicted dehydrogenase